MKSHYTYRRDIKRISRGTFDKLIGRPGRSKAAKAAQKQMFDDYRWSGLSVAGYFAAWRGRIDRELLAKIAS
jgi:hypothetical protein